MIEENSRYIKIDDWIFEIKTVRALKVDKYGEPYSAIANCNINGDTMYVDGLLTKEETEFTKEDVAAFQKFCEKMGIESCSYHRYQNGQSINKEFKVAELDKVTKKKESPNVEAPIRLVK
ncbi:MAG: hypothetical protein HRT52_00090 [Colwellia sp.]|nr:hypothetical protein [Colwellia sp.]